MARHVHRRVGPDRPGEHPDQADPADVGIRRRLHHLGQKGSVRVAAQAVAGGALRGEHLGQLMLGRGGESAGGDLQQFERADAGGAAHRDHREERTPRDRLLQVVDQHRLIDLLAAEVTLHQRLVLGLLDDSLDQGAAQFLDRVGVGRVGLMPCGALAVGVLVVGLRQQTDQSGAGRVGGQVQRQHLVAERLLRRGQRAVVVGAGVVELGDHHRAGHADLAALHPQRLGRLVDAFVGGDHEQRAVGGPQSGPQLARRNRRSRVCRSG